MMQASMCGIPMSEFWKMTPWQLTVAIEALNERMGQEFRRGCWLIWHQAAMIRSTEKMITLAKLMGEENEQVQVIDEDGILAMLKRKAGLENERSNG
mgnify:CR=1 FL=1